MQSPETLAMIERCGAALSRPIETSRLCGIPFLEFKRLMMIEGSDVYQAYYKGLELSKLALREITISVAKQGASAAQTLAFNMLKDLETEIDD
jgi:hypothetical protein